MKVRTSICLDGGLLHKLKREALRQRRSVSQLIEIWVQDVLLWRESDSESVKPQSAAPANSTPLP
jgi:hypothetical protein